MRLYLNSTKLLDALHYIKNVRCKRFDDRRVWAVYAERSARNYMLESNQSDAIENFEI